MPFPRSRIPPIIDPNSPEELNGACIEGLAKAVHYMETEGFERPEILQALHVTSWSLALDTGGSELGFMYLDEYKQAIKQYQKLKAYFSKGGDAETN